MTTIFVTGLEPLDARVEISPWNGALSMVLQFSLFVETVALEQDVEFGLLLAINWLRSRQVTSPELKAKQQAAIRIVQQFLESRAWLAVEHPQEDSMEATKTKQKAKPNSQEKAENKTLRIPVAFSNVSIGEGTARVGVTIDRDDLSVENADSTLCGRRLIGSIVRLKNGESDSQKALPGMDGERHEISGAFDVKSFNCKPKSFTAGLTFSLESIKIEELGYFAKRSGVLLINHVEDLDEGSDEVQENDED